MKAARVLFLAAYGAASALPLAWLVLTSLQSYDDSIRPALKFVPAGSGGTERGGVFFAAGLDAYRMLAEPYAGTQHSFFHYLGNSLWIGAASTLASVALGTCCAYGFSRFRIAGAKDWLFFILSTRFLPPLAVVVPIFLMYREFELLNSHLGLILLYTCFNLSLSVWLMKGFIDEIPRAYEEAALVDGYTRLQAFAKVILPQALPGMLVTAVFCLISAWNEYGFAQLLNYSKAVTVPVYFAGLQGNIQGLPWPQIAAGALLFVTPIVVFTFLARKHLLRGVTFGTVKQ